MGRGRATLIAARPLGGQYQLAVLRDAQPVFAPAMLDDDLAGSAHEIVACDAADGFAAPVRPLGSVG